MILYLGWYFFIKGLFSIQLIDQWPYDQKYIDLLSKINVTIRFLKKKSGVTCTVEWIRLGENTNY